MGGERLIKGVMKSPDIDSSGGVEIDGWYNLLACRNSGVGFSNGWGNRFSEGKDGLSSQLWPLQLWQSTVTVVITQRAMEKIIFHTSIPERQLYYWLFVQYCAEIVFLLPLNLKQSKIWGIVVLLFDVPICRGLLQGANSHKRFSNSVLTHAR